jgi:WhiB family redox-sensing transcriptional regulator
MTDVPFVNSELANCATTDPDVFFPIQEDFRATAITAPVCAVCPVLENCLNYAIANEKFGIWGGASSRERFRMRRTPRNRIVHLAKMTELAKKIREREENNEQ